MPKIVTKGANMKKSLGVKALIYPMPVLIIGTYNEDGTPNAMNAAWGTVCDTDKVIITLSLCHKTVQNILRDKHFTVACADKDNVIPADYVGIVSGNDVPDKIAKTGWSQKRGEKVNAPVFDQLPVALECTLISYDEENEILIGKVLNAVADESVLDEKGRVDLSKYSPVAYDCSTHGYYALTQRVGQAFSDGKKIK